MLPNENAFVANARLRLREITEACQQLIVMALTIIEQRDATKNCVDSDVAFRIGKGLCVKSCKLLRASLSLGLVGAGDGLILLSRTMFETCIVANFVLLDVLKLGNNDPDDGTLTPNARAKLFVAFGFINRHEELKRLKAEPTLTNVLSAVNIKPYEDGATDAERDVGTTWADRFRKGRRTYSGLSLKELTLKIGAECQSSYTTLYGPQSRVAHATDYDNQVEYIDAENRFVAKWITSVDDVAELLSLNALFLWRPLDLLDNQFALSGNTRSELQNWLNQYQATLS